MYSMDSKTLLELGISSQRIIVKKPPISHVQSQLDMLAAPKIHGPNEVPEEPVVAALCRSDYQRAPEIEEW